MICFSPFAAFLYKFHPGFFLRLDARINMNQTWTTETSLSPSSSAIITGSSIYLENVGLTVTMTSTLNSDWIDIFKTTDLIKSTIMMKVMLSTGSCLTNYQNSYLGPRLRGWVWGINNSFLLFYSSPISASRLSMNFNLLTIRNWPIETVRLFDFIIFF